MNELERVLARRLGAQRVVVCGLSFSRALEALALPSQARLVKPLSSVPVTCPDLRALGRAAHDEGWTLVVDNSLPTWAGCAAVRLGATLSVEPLDADVTLVGFADAASELAAGLSPVDEERAAVLLASLDGREASWRQASDTAQVVASYLACHPRVSELRYPGLKADMSFEVAARTLTGGFGPRVSYRLLGEKDWRSLEASPVDDPREFIMRLEAGLCR